MLLHPAKRNVDTVGTERQPRIMNEEKISNTSAAGLLNMMSLILKAMRQARTFFGVRAICREPFGLFLLPRCLGDSCLNLGHVCWFSLKPV